MQLCSQTNVFMPNICLNDASFKLILYDIIQVLLAMSADKITSKWRTADIDNDKLCVAGFTTPIMHQPIQQYHSLDRGLYSAPTQQISAKSDNLRLSYWWLNKFSRQFFQGAVSSELVLRVGWTELYRTWRGPSLTLPSLFRCQIGCSVSKLERPKD